MISVKGIYDNGNIRLLEDVKIEGSKEVIITFIDKDSFDVPVREIYSLADKSSSFDFLKEPGEDIYSDKNLKNKYNK